MHTKTVTDLIQRKPNPDNSKVAWADPILQIGTIAINQNEYTSGLDRIYNTKGFSNMFIAIENTGLDNGLTFTIEGASKEYLLIGTLVDGDFNTVIQADANVASGNVADGTVTCASVLAADTVTINGNLYTAVAGVKANNTQFSIDTSDTACATDLADSITNDTRTGTLNDVVAVSAVGVVTASQTVRGVAGNATTLVSSNGTRLAVSGATFANGADNGINKKAIVDISPETTAIRIRVKRQSAGDDTTMAGIASIR